MRGIVAPSFWTQAHIQHTHADARTHMHNTLQIPKLQKHLSKLCPGPEGPKPFIKTPLRTSHLCQDHNWPQAKLKDRHHLLF